MARRKKVCFRARKIVKVPTRVSFKTKDGRRVSFRATKAVKKPVRVCFYAKRKRRKWEAKKYT